MNIAIVGASGGIGSGLLNAILDSDIATTVYATSFESDLGAASLSGNKHTLVKRSTLDASSEQSILSWVGEIDSLDWLINCVGHLHDDTHAPEKSIRQFDPTHFNKNISINCLPTLLLAKHVFKKFDGSSAPIFATVSARVGSISDNRLGGWYSYRAAKAALNMSLRTLSIEWARLNPAIRVAALHPGTTDTALSKPFQKNVATEKLFSAQKTAELLLAQLHDLHQHPSGRFIAYDGKEIPW